MASQLEEFLLAKPDEEIDGETLAKNAEFFLMIKHAGSALEVNRAAAKAPKQTSSSSKPPEAKVDQKASAIKKVIDAAAVATTPSKQYASKGTKPGETSSTAPKAKAAAALAKLREIKLSGGGVPEMKKTAFFSSNVARALRGQVLADHMLREGIKRAPVSTGEKAWEALKSFALKANRTRPAQDLDGAIIPGVRKKWIRSLPKRTLHDYRMNRAPDDAVYNAYRAGEALKKGLGKNHPVTVALRHKGGLPYGIRETGIMDSPEQMAVLRSVLKGAGMLGAVPGLAAKANNTRMAAMGALGLAGIGGAVAGNKLMSKKSDDLEDL